VLHEQRFIKTNGKYPKIQLNYKRLHGSGIIQRSRHPKCFNSRLTHPRHYKSKGTSASQLQNFADVQIQGIKMQEVRAIENIRHLDAKCDLENSRSQESRLQTLHLHIQKPRSPVRWLKIRAS